MQLKDCSINKTPTSTAFIFADIIYPGHAQNFALNVSFCIFKLQNMLLMHNCFENRILNHDTTTSIVIQVNLDSLENIQLL